MEGPFSLDGDVIVIHREMTLLDSFVQDFLEVFSKYSDYLVVSGFVSIASGRTRATEDVDLLFPILSEGQFTVLFKELLESGFWCYQTDDPRVAFDSMQEGISVRFARESQLFPNMECIPISESMRAKWFEFTHPQWIRIGSFKFKAPPIEFEILYKELILRGKKDLEDAQHLRTVYSWIISDEKFKIYEPIVRSALK